MPTTSASGRFVFSGAASAQIYPPAITAVLVTQYPVEVSLLPTPQVRVTQYPVEATALPTPQVRVTQYPVEATALPTPQVRVTQYVIEVTYLGNPMGSGLALAFAGTAWASTGNITSS